MVDRGDFELRLIPTVYKGWPGQGRHDDGGPTVDFRGVPIPMYFQVEVAVFETTEAAAPAATICAFYRTDPGNAPVLRTLHAEGVGVPEALDLLRSRFGLRLLLETGIKALAPEQAKWGALLDGAGYEEALSRMQIARERATELPLTNRSDPVALSRIREAADVYNAAVRNKQWPVAAVTRHFGVSRTTAHRYLKRAEVEGIEIEKPAAQEPARKGADEEES